MMMLSDLPEDLEAEILSRVAAKSLSELKTTCKRWYALFRDPSFVEKNKKMNKSVRASMLLSNQNVYSIDKDLRGVEPSSPPIEFTIKHISLKKGSKDLNLSRIFHCDGLMLCETRDSFRLVVWNPCTGQTRLIKPTSCFRRDDNYTLGYTNTSSGRSYKISRYYWYCKNEQRFAECEIYELSSDSWRRVLDSFPLDHWLQFDGVSLKGDTYWITRGNEAAAAYFLMKFDFTTEKFVRLPLPFQVLDPPDGEAVMSVVNDEKLWVLHRSTLAGSYVMKIWVSNNVYDDKDLLSWSSHFVLKIDFDKFHIPDVANLARFVLDEENKVVICCDIHSVGLGEYKTRIYIVGDGMFKQVYNATVNQSRFTWPGIITYVPSLVHIHKCSSTPKKKKGRLLALNQ